MNTPVSVATSYELDNGSSVYAGNTDSLVVNTSHHITKLVLRIRTCSVERTTHPYPSNEVKRMHRPMSSYHDAYLYLVNTYFLLPLKGLQRTFINIMLL
jgi:hypothetical protein